MPEATASTKSNVIAPHGGELIDRTVSGDEATALAAEAGSLPRVRMSDKQTADLDMIASGALSPLTGFMTKADYDGAVEEMHLANGLPWALPVTLSVADAPKGDRIALESAEGELLGVLNVEEVFSVDRENEAVRDESKRNLARCTELVEQCFTSNDYTEGRRAFMEKRKPAFTGT